MNLIYVRDVVVGEGHVSIDIDKPTCIEVMPLWSFSAH